MTEPRSCPSCGNPVPASNGAGRPRTWCSDACRYEAYAARRAARRNARPVEVVREVVETERISVQPLSKVVHELRTTPSLALEALAAIREVAVAEDTSETLRNEILSALDEVGVEAVAAARKDLSRTSTKLKQWRDRLKTQERALWAKH